MFLFLGACSFIPPRAEFLYTDVYNRATYSIECNNIYDMGYCYKKANQTCPYGFEVIDKSKNSDSKILIFQCK